MSPKPVIQVVNLKRWLRRFRHIGRNLFSKSLMSEIGEYVIARIQIRTAEGRDANNTAFKPYSKSYALFRQKHGRQSGKVNLFFTGSMMSSMTYEASEDTVRVFFMNTPDKSGTSNALKAFGLNKKRNFFAINAQEQDAIERIVQDHIDNTLRSRGR